MEIGIGRATYGDYEDPYLDLLHQADLQWEASRNWPNNNDKKTYSQMLAAGEIDRTTWIPNRIPAGYDYVSTPLFRAGARDYPAYYAGTYVFEWDGDGDARCGFGVATTTVSANRIECTYAAGDTNWSTVEITRMGAGFSNPRLYRKENETLIKSGEIFSPAWVKLVSGYKIVRAMDAVDTNSSTVVKTSQLATSAMIPWSAQTTPLDGDVSAPRGTPIDVLFKLAVKTNTALWLNTPPLLGAPAAADDYKWFSDPDGLRALATANYSSILASPEWRSYADRIVSTMVASGYPKNHVLFQELANEIWNFGGPSFSRSTRYYWGLGEAIPNYQGEAFRYALGYLTANYAVAFADALQAAGRSDQAWVIVLASQNDYLARTEWSLMGFKRYFEDRGMDPAPWLARTGVSTASYFYGVTDKTTGLFKASDDATRDQMWLDAIQTDPQGLMKKATDWFLTTPDSAGAQSVPHVIARRVDQKALAESYGAFFLGDYEGDNHDTLGEAPNLKTNPVFVNWMEDYRRSDEFERANKGWIDALLAQDPNAVIANYYSVGAFDPQGSDPNDASLADPWIDGFWTDNTGRMRALDQYLRH